MTKRHQSQLFAALPGVGSQPALGVTGLRLRLSRELSARGVAPCHGTAAKLPHFVAR